MKKRELLLGILGLTLIWRIAALLIDNPILPGPLEVAAVFVSELGNGLALHFLVSLWRVLVSVALAVIVAAPLGIMSWDKANG